MGKEQTVYIKDKVKTGLLYFFGFIAIGASLALIVWFISILRLRTEYREFCLEVNEAILATAEGDRRIGRGEESFPASREMVDYYDMLLLADGVTVISRDEATPDEHSIVLTLKGGRLILTNVEKDGSLINIRWETAEGVRSYNLRSSQISFMSISAYYSNYARRMRTQAG